MAALVAVAALASCPALLANPIPVPTLIMDREYITIYLRVTRSGLLVTVEGAYPFKNMGHSSVTMYFPVPPEALRGGRVEVYCDGSEVRWSVGSETYKTAIGGFPMIVWRLDNLKKNFTVTVRYSYSLPSPPYRVLYAMATGRFLNGTYTKQCVAEVRFVVMGAPESWAARVSFVPPPEEGFGVGYDAQLEVPLAQLSSVVLRRASGPFRGLDRDLLIEVLASPGGQHGGQQPQHAWVPYFPRGGEFSVGINASAPSKLRVVVRFVFRHSGFRATVTEKKVEGGTIVLGLSVEEWTGPALQVITPVALEEEYELEPGRYTLVLKINGVEYLRRGVEVRGEQLIAWGAVVAVLVAAALTAAALLLLLMRR